MASIPMTAQGAKRLAAELKNLKAVVRPEVIEAISTARAQGDLSENAEYDAAREKQAFVEGRIKELESVLSSANVIDPSTLDVDGQVVFGATVELVDLDTDAEITYQIVGDFEADIKQNTISVSSPVARALIGKSVGDTITVRTPAGEREYEVLDVHYR
ncbi:transcription elongation factor GreA [Brackiella oedipodis]|uniref:transcription elongation factor GreA n=1 Tax=Brackiella oedipodis TaxID=124225 RepID=UPI00048DBC13|nr:transcription elongation factor GreA [Brackiella oedipodis]